MIYLRAGLYAEGPTDYRFLLKLLDRVIPALATEVLTENFESAESLGIDAPRSKKRARREERIAAAIDEHWDECTIFVIHADGAGDPDAAKSRQVEPGIGLARAGHPDLAAAACVPVRETEAWMLVDESALCTVFEKTEAPALPRDPEKEADPKKRLADVIDAMGAPSTDYYARFGSLVRVDALRRLPAFQRFEADLRAAIEAVARPAQGA